MVPGIGIFSWRGDFYVVAQLIDASGLAQDRGAITIVNQSAPPDQLGAAILMALSQFGAAVPPGPGQGKRKEKEPILAATGASSLTALWKEAQYVSCTQSASDTLRFYPSGRPSRGLYLFKGKDQVVEIPTLSLPQAIGAAAQLTFERCD
jgi:hypothetical protein